MKRASVRLEAVVEFDRLAWAFWRAAKGKRDRADVDHFSSTLESSLEALANSVLDASYRPAPLRKFVVHDPKRRIIHAPAFRDRVLHHALSSVLEPRLERALGPHAHACRVGMGTTSAIAFVRRQLGRHPWYATLDVRAYFASIDHDRLQLALARRIRSSGLIDLCMRIAAGYSVEPGSGLPIGALSSQLFANLFLQPLDRFLREHALVLSHVRYMDDTVWWTASRESARETWSEASSFLRGELGLESHGRVIQRSTHGLNFLGVRVHAEGLRPGPRRRRRYRSARRRWERAYRCGAIDSNELQRGYDACLATLEGTRSRPVRAADLRVRPPVDA